MPTTGVTVFVLGSITETPPKSAVQTSPSP